MSDEKPTPITSPEPAAIGATGTVPKASIASKIAPASQPAFQGDAFVSETKSQSPRPEPAMATTPAMPPAIAKRGGIGFFTAFLMSSVAAIGGAYLALFAGSHPDLLQKAGVAAFVPQPPQAPSLGTMSGNIVPLEARLSAVEAELLALKTRLNGVVTPSAQSPLPTASGTGTQKATTPLVPVPAGTTTTNAPAIGMADMGALKSELQGISGRVVAIETRLAALDPTGAGGAIVAGLQADIAGLKSIIGTLQQQVTSAPSPAATFAVVNLAEAANRAGPFMIELETVRAAMPGVPEVAALEPYAQSGVPTREVLRERFATLAAALAASQATTQKGSGIMAWFKGLFGDMVKVQSAPDANGTSNAAILGRAKVKLDLGDFQGSLDEVAAITAPPSALTDWVAAGRRRLELESRISAVRGAIGRAQIAPSSGGIVPSAGATLSPPPVPVTKIQGTNP